MTVLTPLLTPMVLVYHECKTVFLSSVWSAPIIQGRIQVGVIEAIAPRKRTKTTLFTMIFTIRKTAFAIYGHFGVHCFVTAVLWSILPVSCRSELVVRLSWQPNITKSPSLNLLAESTPAVILFALICSATILTSKLVTEIIDNHSEFYVRANSCSKFLSSRSW